MCPPEAVCVSIERFFTDRLSVLRAAGVGRERVIIDPGLGYFLGSNPQPSPTVMAGTHDVSALHDALIVHDAISTETSR
jgi:dihydropteroate synthase type 2